MKTPGESLRRIFSKIGRFFPLRRIYGFSVAFWTLLFPLHHLFACCGPFSGVKKHGAILEYLIEHYGEILKGFTGKNTAPELFILPESTIWVCWWDGEEAMPALVKVCYKSILRHAGSHPVRLVTKYNYGDFIPIPKYIVEKVNAGIITITHFSDILRAALLYKYGGIWMDATVLVLADITLENMAFYSLKAPAKKSASITLARFAGLSNTSTASKIRHDGPQTSRWSGFLFAGTQNAVIFELVRDILYAYWKDHNDQIEYLLFDYVIALGYDNVPAIREMIDHVPLCDAEKFELEKSLNNEYSEEGFSRFSLTPFHKLTWKKNFNIHTANNKPTIYGYLLDQFN